MEPECECPGPGDCPRYGIKQGVHAHSVCQRSDAYRRKWRLALAESKTPRSRPAVQLGPLVALPRTSSPSPPKPVGGPGTELKKLLSSLGVHAEGCGCGQRATQMDGWGVAGCRERREEILGWLREQQAKLGWIEKLAVGVRAVASGLAFRLDPADPAAGLLDEALRRAESVHVLL